jgi:hypothetical protein
MLEAPNGWRLSGDGGGADGVRCSRGLGHGPPLIEEGSYAELRFAIYGSEELR